MMIVRIARSRVTGTMTAVLEQGHGCGRRGHARWPRQQPRCSGYSTFASESPLGSGGQGGSDETPGLVAGGRSARPARPGPGVATGRRRGSAAGSRRGEAGRRRRVRARARAWVCGGAGFARSAAGLHPPSSPTPPYTTPWRPSSR